MSNQSSNNNGDEYEKLRAMAPLLVGLQDALLDFRRKRIYSASNWILAGALAFMFAIIQNPEQMIHVYGHWKIKIAMLLFLTSFFFGFLNLIAGGMAASFAESERLKTIIEANYLLDKIQEADGEKKEEDTAFNAEAVASEGLANALKIALKGTKIFWLQLFSFLVGTAILILTFMLIS